jgi:hypothetical protein
MMTTLPTTMIICRDCQTDMKADYCMLTDATWHQAAPEFTNTEETGDELLCIRCLERRLGRELHFGDFTQCRLNQMVVYNPESSPLLRDRMWRDPPTATTDS